MNIFKTCKVEINNFMQCPGGVAENGHDVQKTFLLNKGENYERINTY
jgi:hypothetical protein